MVGLTYLQNVAILKLDEQQCVGCGMCLTVCPHEVFRLNGKKATVVQKDSCMECGACATNCPVGAIEVRVGVGCAQAIFQQLLRRKDTTCC